MNVLIAQAKLKTDRVLEVREASRKLFAALNEAEPEGVRYAWVLFPDGETCSWNSGTTNQWPRIAAPFRRSPGGSPWMQ